MGHARKGAADKVMHPFSILGVAVVVSTAMWCVSAQTVPCTVSHYVDPGERRMFRFQRAGLNQDMLCVFTFQTAADEPIGVAVFQLDFGNVNEKNCTCGSLRIFDVSDTGEQLLSETRCAGETSEVEDGPIMAAQASGNVVVVTLSTKGCPGPQLWFAVGTLTDRELQVASATTDPGGSVTTSVSTTMPLVTERTPVVARNSSSTQLLVSTDTTIQPKIVERIQEIATSTDITDITDLTPVTENTSTDSDTQTTTEPAPSTVNESTEENTTEDDEQITTTESVTLNISDSSSTGTPFTEGSISDADEQISTTVSETLNINVTTEESTPDEQTSTTQTVAETTSEEQSTTPPLSEFGDRSLTDTTEEQTTYESTTEVNEVQYQSSEGSSSDFGNSASEMTSQDSTYSTELFETTSSSFEETTFEGGELEVSEQTTDGFDVSTDTEDESSSTTSSFDRFTTSAIGGGFEKSSPRNNSSETTDFPETTTKAKRRWWPFG